MMGMKSRIAPMLYIRDQLIYGLPAQINDLNMRVRLPDSAIIQTYRADTRLDYETIVLKEGQSKKWRGRTITMLGVDRVASHAQYSAREGVIAINAIVEFKSNDMHATARPLFFIRGNRPLNLKARIPDMGIHVRFTRIDPDREEFYFDVAYNDQIDQQVQVEIAERVPRDDFIVLEAIVFPGINLVWTGSLMMMFGLLLAAWRKRKS